MVAIGNSEQAFVEKRITNGVNIIISDDNDRGKTIVIQSILFVLGNVPVYPTSFDWKNHYFYLSIDVNNSTIEILRKRNQFIVIDSKNSFQIFETVKDFTKYFDKEIYKLPQFIKNEKKETASLDLFHQLYFVGQDERSTSNIVNAGRYNKVDFLNMLAFMKYDYLTETGLSEKINKLKSELKNLKIDIDKKNKSIKYKKRLKKYEEATNLVEVEKKFKRVRLALNKRIKEISELEKDLARLENFMSTRDRLKNELNSLNKELNYGNVKCNDCGSKNIIYSSKDDSFSFNVSNSDIRRKILESIDREILTTRFEINEKKSLIREKINDRSQVLVDEGLTHEDYVYFSEFNKSLIDYNDELKELLDIKDSLELEITTLENQKKNSSKESKLAEKKILELMKKEYHYFDNEGNLEFDSLFTKRNVTHSGSDRQEFMSAKLIAINKFLELPFPIIIDAFREGELSTNKEELMIPRFEKLNTQVILSCTLKKEEHFSNKYSELKNVNKIDYSKNEKNHILSAKALKEFKEIISKFNITL
ncbi:hypothetical protein RU98_GL001052 [Enterococcus caccae]|nr:hypothetical protein RU98_GL001052 [Enterococcus caccae]